MASNTLESMPLVGPEGREQLRVAARASTVGIEIVTAPLIGYFGGHWLDAKLSTAPWLMWIGLALGVAAGVRSVYATIRRINMDKL